MRVRLLSVASALLLAAAGFPAHSWATECDQAIDVPPLSVCTFRNVSLFTVAGGPRDLKNDLDLRVRSPSGIQYWGNYGLGNHRLLPGGVSPSNWSLPYGWADDRNNVENVFIENPAAGDWTVRVSLRDLVQDGHLETAEYDVDFALVVTMLPPP